MPPKASQASIVINDLKNVLYPYQKDYILDDSRFIVWIASRQIGKSFAASFKALLAALNGKNTIFISTNQRNARRLIKSCKKNIRLLSLITKKKIKLTLDNADEIQIKEGGLIISLANNPDTAVGETGNIVIDEAARFKNSVEILDAVQPFITRGYSLTMISTPLGKRGMFWEAYQKTQMENSKWKLYRHDIYEAIKLGCPVKIDDIKSEFDEISFRQNFLCEFIDDISSYFNYELILSNIDYSLHNYTIEELSKNKFYMIAGYDPGKLVDSGVFSVIHQHPQTGKKEVIHLKEFMRVNYSEQIAYIIQTVKSGNIGRLYVDATGVGVKIAEDLRRHLGSTVKEITYTNKIKEQMITELKLEMERNTISFPDHPKLIDQLHGIEREILASGLSRYQHQAGKHDDYVFSICNGVLGFSRGLGKPNTDNIIIGKKLASLDALI